jgi:hypothetical protein
MDKNQIKTIIGKIILASPELKEDYDILLKNKIGYMTNKMHSYYGTPGNGPAARIIKAVAAGSEESLRDMYRNMLNSRVKIELEKLSGGKIDNEKFNAIMREVIDDLSDTTSR